MRLRPLLAVVAPVALGAVVSTPPSPDPARRASLAEALVPEPLLSPDGVVVTASAPASRAGARLLAEGGNAVDAAVAAAFALSAADPSESGIGGEAWLLYQPPGGLAVAVLCPARVPARVDADALRRAAEVAGPGGHVAAVAPTAVATLARALARYGTKSLAEVLAPAIEEAERGWTVGWYEASLLRANAGKLTRSPLLGPVLFPGACGSDGWPAPLAEGDRGRLPALARTLRRLAEAGAADFYRGRIADAIDADMRAGGGFVRKDDLARVPALVLEAEPARAAYRDREVLAVGPPAGGGVLADVLRILGTFPSETVRGTTADATQLLLDAVRIAFEEDRAAAGGGGFGSRPHASSGAAARAGEIRLGTAWNAASLRAPSPPAVKAGGTTQVSVVDARGGAVSLTQTLGDDWGSGAAAEALGFPYNSALRWIAADPRAGAAALRPGTLLRAPVSPAIVLREGSVEMVLGSGGSSRIVPALAAVLRNVVDGGMGLAEALEAPRVLWQDEPGARRVVAEATPPVTDALLADLKARGYADQWRLGEPESGVVSFGGVNAVRWNAAANAWEGAGDPRRRGVAAAPERPAPAPR